MTGAINAYVYGRIPLVSFRSLLIFSKSAKSTER